MIAIETQLLLLRNFRAEDADSLQKIIIQKETAEYAAYDYEWPTSLEKIKEDTAWFANQDSFMAVCLKETGKLIGMISLDPPEGFWYDNWHFNLGFDFDFDYHGQGYATEGCKALVNYAFYKIKAECITSETAACNRPAWRLLERIGFKKIGQRTFSYRNTPDGKPIEFTGWEYALSREDWSKNQAEPGHQRVIGE